MVAYLLKRLLAMIPTLLGISFLTFLIVLLSPGDPVATQMGGGGGGGPSATAGGGGDQLNNQANAIKAKKKLLGMLEEHFAVVTWDATEATKARDWKGDDKYSRVTEIEESADIDDLPGWARSLALSADGATLYVGTKTGEIVVVGTSDGEATATWDALPNAVWALGVSQDGATVVSSDADGQVRIHDAADGTVRHAADSLGRPVNDIVFLPDGERFVTACDDGVIRVHLTANGAIDRTLSDHNNFVRALALSADGSHMWSGGYDGDLREWSTASWTVERVVGEHQQAITDIALAPDEKRAATASEDKVIRVFTTGVENDAPLVELGGHYHEVSAVVFHPDGRTLFSGGRDETVRAWDVELARQTAQVPQNTGRVFGLVLSSDGSQLWTAAESWRKTPIPRQYWNWLSNTARGDFGRSFTDQVPVIDKIAERLPVTLYLNLIAIVIMYIVSIPLGVAAAVKRGTPFDNVTSFLVFLLWSVPSFWMATMLITYLSSIRNWDAFPSVGLHDVNQRDMSYLTWLGDWAAHLVLPMIVLTYSGFASLSRYARTSMLETISQDFVRTARAKGLSERVVVYKHALRNSLIAIITLLGSLLPAMIGGSVIVEYIFNIRGMGLLAFEAILQRDYPVIMAVTTFSALLTLMGVLVSDLLYGIADPRITHK